MDDTDKMPDIKQVLGALIFGANRALKIAELRKCLLDVAEKEGGETKAFAKVKNSDIVAALKELEADLRKANVGFFLIEVSSGHMLQSDVSCGKWLRNLLDKGRPDRLSRPALETLSIIAYRQPVTKSSIEAIRGVDVGHMIKTLMEMQLVRIDGRSDLPGKPFLYATTNIFLEHFGLKDLKELSDVDPMLALRKEAGAEAAAEGEKVKAEGKEKKAEAEAVLAKDEGVELDFDGSDESESEDS